jgi:hypothetical protein
MEKKIEDEIVSRMPEWVRLLKKFYQEKEEEPMPEESGAQK